MTSRQYSTRHSSSQADSPTLSSSIYFEQWEIRDAARNNRFIGNNALFASRTSTRIPTNVLSCWEVNMGYTEHTSIPKGLNDIECWKELVTPCCHCVSFKQDRPLKKKLLTFSSHQDIGIAERYKCQTLWEALYRPLYEKSKSAGPKKKQKRTRVEVANAPCNTRAPTSTRRTRPI